MKYRNEVTEDTPLYERGRTFVQMNDGGAWEFSTNYHRSKVDLWFIGQPREIMSRLGIEVEARRAKELVDLMDGDLSGFYYVAAASDGTDEAIKWIMGSLAALLNERGIPFSEVSRLLPADYLKAFVAALKEGKFEKSFAKDVFLALIDAPRSGLVEYFPGWTTPLSVRPKRVERFLPERVLEPILADPRFKAADTSELDTLIDQVIAANPIQFEKAKTEPKLIQFLLGQTMKLAKGRGVPQQIKAKIEERLA